MSVRLKAGSCSLSFALAVMCVATSSSYTQTAPSPARVVEEGIAVEFATEGTVGQGPARSGDDVRFRFRVSDTASGSPLQGLKPAAWLDLRRSGQPADPKSCTKKVAAFLGDSLVSVPQVDLNAWYVLTMNEDASISVVNPRFGFGGSQLLNMVFLDGPAEDWALTADQQRLFVSMPDSGRVAVVDAASWKIVARLDVASRPGRVAIQPDGKYLWVSDNEGITAFDCQTLKASPRIPTGAGPHEFAFSSDSRFVFVTNHGAGTVSVIDDAEGRKVADVSTSGHPSSVTFSELSRTAYVANDDEGIVAVNTHGMLVAHITASPNIRQIRAAPGGRFIFAVSPSKEQLHIIDSSSNRMVQTGVIHGGPDQVTFSSTLAYVRRRSDATVMMVPLDRIGSPDAPLPLVDVTGGQLPFSQGSRSTPADSIVRVPGSNAVLMANPADRAVYYYQEGMAAPMGQFQNYGHEPRAVMTIDRSLEEESPGLYQTVGRVPEAGVYDVVFFLDSPRVVHCFEFEAASASGEPIKPRAIVVISASEKNLQAGRTARLRFQVIDGDTHDPIKNLRDLRALVFEQPGVWQTRQALIESVPGFYETEFTPPSSGVYQAYFESSSLGLRFNSPHVVTFIASDRDQTKSQNIGAH
ncbi:MAG: YncE family protein [Candidatus Sulfotelmatobacter sp.]